MSTLPTWPNFSKMRCWSAGAMPAAVRSEVAGSAGKLREVQRALLGDGTIAGTIGSSAALALLVVYLIYFAALFGDRHKSADTDDDSAGFGFGKAWLYLLIGLGIVGISAELTVHGAIGVAAALDIGEMGGRTIALRQRMQKTDKPDEWTEIAVDDVEYDLELKDSLFTLSNLRNPRE